MDTVAGTGWIDGLMLLLLAGSVALGLWRGLVFELMSLVGWLVAWLAARWLTVPIAPWVPVGATGSPLHVGASFAAAFVLALLAWGLAARLVRLVIRATPLTVLDRAAGAVFGLVRGLLLLLLAAVLVWSTPAARSEAWQQSRGAVWLATVLHGLRPLLPEALMRHLPD